MNITIFTPTFNRAYIIEQLYRSLQRQKYKDFEWLVIDDGSTDDTDKLFEKWKEEDNSFSIRYYKQSNGGKCRAINRALDLARGRLFFIVDSDDYLSDDALLKVVKWESDLPPNELFCGIVGNLGTSSTETPNTLFHEEYYEGTLLDRYKNVDGERAIVFYTEIHRKYRYPEFENEKFMTEAVVYNRMAHDGYKIRVYNDIICVYEYQENGLTKSGNSVFVNNPRGYGLWLREKAKFMNYSVFEKIKVCYTFTCGLMNKCDNKKIAESIGAPIWLIYICKMLHKCINIVKEKGSKA